MTLRNMCAKVTPKPLNEPVNVPTSQLLFWRVGVGSLGGPAADGGGRALGYRTPGAWARRHLQVDRRYREAARRPRGQLLLDRQLAWLARGRPEQRDQQDDHEDAGDGHDPGRGALQVPHRHPDPG